MIDWTKSDYPENCPPKDSIEYSGSIFVFVKHNPPKQKDFLSAYDKKRLPEADPCLRRAISCGTNIEYLNSIKKLFPFTKGWKKAKGNVSKNDGLIKQTGNQILHFSFWISPEKRSSFHTLFEMV